MVSGICSVIFHPPSLSLGFCLYFWRWLCGCGEGFSCLWVCRGDSIPCGIGTAFGKPACSSLTGLSAEQQRNCHPAGLLMHPMNSVWTQRGAKNRVRGCTITSLFFTPKSHCSRGRDPGVWSAAPSTAGPCEIFPISTCSGKLAWMETPSASGML